MTTSKTALAMLAMFAAALALIAWASPSPDRVTDRGLYEATAAQVIVPDCSDLQCFRVLVPWTLGRLPGPSAARWKAYAALANAGAAVGVWFLCLTLGFPRRAAVMAAVISGFGFGSLYTLHDPFTSDPLMYAAGPWTTAALLLGRFGTAAAIAVVGVFAKEFAAAPLYAFAAFAVSSAAGRRPSGLRRGQRGVSHLGAADHHLMLRFDYTYGWKRLGRFQSRRCARTGCGIRARGIAFAMFNEFGALSSSRPQGPVRAARPAALVLVSLPIAAIFG